MEGNNSVCWLQSHIVSNFTHQPAEKMHRQTLRQVQKTTDE